MTNVIAFPSQQPRQRSRQARFTAKAREAFRSMGFPEDLSGELGEIYAEKLLALESNPEFFDMPHVELSFTTALDSQDQATIQALVNREVQRKLDLIQRIAVLETLVEHHRRHNAGY